MKIFKKHIFDKNLYPGCIKNYYSSVIRKLIVQLKVTKDLDKHFREEGMIN